MTGMVDVFWKDRRYGFLRDAEHQSHFFHQNNLTPDSALPERGSIVEFQIGKGWSGKPQAVNVRVLSKEDVLGGGAR